MLVVLAARLLAGQVVDLVEAGALGGVAASSLAADWTAGVRAVLMPAVVGVLLAFQVGALVLARRGVAAGQDGEGEREGPPRSG